MLTDDLTLRTYLPSQEAEVVQLLKESLGDANPATPRSTAYWRWKHFANPFGQSYILLAVDTREARIAGVRTMMRWSFVAPGGELCSAVRAVDTATHPRYQRRGIFSRLTLRSLEDLRAEGVGFVFNTPNEKSLPGYLKMGWQKHEARRLYVRVLKPLRFLRGVSGRLSGPVPTPSAEPPLIPWHDFWATNRDALDLPVGRTDVRLGLKTPLSWEYLFWRYGSHPTVKYYVLPWSEKDVLSGIAILRPNVRFGLRELVLADLLGSPGGLRASLRPLVRHYDYVVCHFASRHPIQAHLRRAGFVPVPRRKMDLVVRPLAMEMAEITRHGWDLRLSDLELF